MGEKGDADKIMEKTRSELQAAGPQNSLPGNLPPLLQLGRAGEATGALVAFCATPP